MNQVLEVNLEDFDCRVQTGVNWRDLNTHLRDTGLWFPVGQSLIFIILSLISRAKRGEVDGSSVSLQPPLLSARLLIESVCECSEMREKE